jgi:hypothetical protein
VFTAGLSGRPTGDTRMRDLILCGYFKAYLAARYPPKE